MSSYGFYSHVKSASVMYNMKKKSASVPMVILS